MLFRSLALNFLDFVLEQICEFYDFLGAFLGVVLVEVELLIEFLDVAGLGLEGVPTLGECGQVGLVLVLLADVAAHFV